MLFPSWADPTPMRRHPSAGRSPALRVRGGRDPEAANRRENGPDLATRDPRGPGVAWQVWRVRAACCALRGARGACVAGLTTGVGPGRPRTTTELVADVRARPTELVPDRH